MREAQAEGGTVQGKKETTIMGQGVKGKLNSFHWRSPLDKALSRPNLINSIH